MKEPVHSGGEALPRSQRSASAVPEPETHTRAIPDLDAMVKRYLAAQAAWMATGDEDGNVNAEGPAYEEAWQACKDIIFFQCRTPEEAVAKVKVILGHAWVRDTAAAGFDDDDYEVTDLLQTLIPPPGRLASPQPFPLQSKIDAFLAAREAFLAADEDDDEVAWDIYCATEHEVIIHLCTTIEEVHLKARFFLECEPAYDTIRNCRGAEEETLRPFLRSLAGGVRA